MGYAALALAVAGFAVGMVFRLNILLLVIGLLLLVSILFSIGSEFSFFDTLLTIMAVQTIIQGSFFLGLIARSVLTADRLRHLF
jgi:hypothetical protein